MEQRDPYRYPRHWVADVVLADGGTVHLRPVTPDDADKLVAFHAGLSDRTRYYRYFGAYPRIPQRDLVRFSTVDHHDRVALLALLGDDVIGVGRYETLAGGTSAEVAFVIADEHQGRGLGSILLEHLAAAARESGLDRFVAEVLAENAQMTGVFLAAGYRVSREFDDGVLHLEFDIDPTERSVAVARAREQAAEAASVRNLLHPRSVAVIGASADPTKIGHVVLANLLAARFTGSIYPVNSQARSVHGVPAYPSVTAIPDPVDLAVIAVPASGVDEVMDHCLAKGVKALVVLSSGFADAGADGVTAQRRMAAEARAHGMRVIGPNALGVVNTDGEVRLNASLATGMPGRGRTGFFCQSGALGIAILADAAARGLGLSTFVSAGNRADVSGNDLLQYWETDPRTDVVLLYLESFGNPRKFARLARRLGRRKPVVAVKSGRHVIRPELAATSTRIDDAAVAALFEQAGVIRVESIAQLFDTALLLANQPLPAGDRIAVVGNSTAIGLLAADTALAQGMRLAFDPVDIGAQADPARLADAVASALAHDEVDALVVVFVPPVSTPAAEYAAAVRSAAEHSAAVRSAAGRTDTDGHDAKPGKPIVSTFLAVEGVPDELAVPDAGSGTPGRGSIPSYPSPERAVLALARAHRYARWRATPQGALVRPDGIDSSAARDLVSTLCTPPHGEPTRVSDADTVRLLDHYGIPIVPFDRADDVDAAVAAADRLGYPVAVKAADDRRAGTGDLSMVRLDLADADAVRRAYPAVVDASGGDAVIVQRMAAPGVSCVVGLVDDPSFGSLVYFGLAGVISDLVGDRAYRAVPLTDVDARWLVRAPKAAPLLSGYRGAEPADLDALAQLLLRVSALADDLPQVRSLELDPVLAGPHTVAVTNARMRLGPPLPPTDTLPRRLFSFEDLR